MYPRYFKNKITNNIYMFISEKEGALHIVNDNVSRFSSDYRPRTLRSHTDEEIWEEVTENGDYKCDKNL